MKKWTLGIVLLLAPVTATVAESTQQRPGFTTDDMANFAREARQDSQIKAARTLFAETETLRAAFVINPTRAFVALPRNERDVLQRAADPSTERRMLALQWFMRGGIAKASIIDNALLSAIYHPVAQVWLLIRWDRAGGRWRVADAAFAPASSFAATATDSPTDIPGSYRQATSDFAQLTEDLAVPTIFASRIGDRAGARAAAFERIDAAMATLGRFYGDASQARALAGLETALEDSNAAWVSAALILPQPARATLAPVAATRTANGVSVWLSSPFAPATLIAADWAGGDFGKRPVVRAVALDRRVTVAASEGAAQ